MLRGRLRQARLFRAYKWCEKAVQKVTALPATAHTQGPPGTQLRALLHKTRIFAHTSDVRTCAHTDTHEEGTNPRANTRHLRNNQNRACRHDLLLTNEERVRPYQVTGLDVEGDDLAGHRGDDLPRGVHHDLGRHVLVQLVLARAQDLDRELRPDERKEDRGLGETRRVGKAWVGRGKS